MADKKLLEIKVKGTQGSELAKKLRKLERLGSIKGYKLGWPVGAKYPDGTEIAKVALWQEFGVPENNLPERPFFRNANRHFSRIAGRLILKHAENGVVTEAGTIRIAKEHIRLVQTSLDLIKNPPLKTRVGGNPLIDQGRLKRHLMYELIK